MLELDRSQVIGHICDKIKEDSMLTRKICEKYDFIIDTVIDGRKHIILMNEKTTVILVKLRNVWREYIYGCSYVYHDNEGIYLLHRPEKKLMYWNAIVTNVFYADLNVGDYRISEDLHITEGGYGIKYDQTYSLKVMQIRDKPFILVNNFTYDHLELKQEVWLGEDGKIIDTDIIPPKIDKRRNLWMTFNHGYLFLNDLSFPVNGLCYGHISTSELHLLTKEMKERILILMMIFKRIKDIKCPFHRYIPKSLLLNKII